MNKSFLSESIKLLVKKYQLSEILEEIYSQTETETSEQDSDPSIGSWIRAERVNQDNGLLLCGQIKKEHIHKLSDTIFPDKDIKSEEEEDGNKFDTAIIDELSPVPSFFQFHDELSPVPSFSQFQEPEETEPKAELQEPEETETKAELQEPKEVSQQVKDFVHKIKAEKKGITETRQQKLEKILQEVVNGLTVEEQLKKNNISLKTFTKRYFDRRWTFERACTQPTRIKMAPGEQEKHVKEILQQELNGKKIADILIERNISVDTFTRRYIYQNMPLEKACSNLVPLTEQINKQQKLQDDILYIKPKELAKNLNIPITSLSEYIESGDLPPTNNGKWLRKDIENNSFYQRHLNK